MKISGIIISIIPCLALSTVAFASEKTHSKTQEKTGEPYQHQEKYAHPAATFCWPQPTILNAFENDRILDFYFRGQGFSIDEVDLETVRVFNIPPYSGPVQRVGRWLKTDCFIMRFLGAGGFRPIPPEGYQTTYPLSVDLKNGEHIEMIGRYELVVIEGDLNFDGEVNIEDVVFLTDYIFAGGPMATIFGEEMPEFMDLNGDERITTEDIDYLIAITGLVK